jgi:hypothetical protein
VVDAVQALLPDPFGDRSASESQRHELPPSHHAVLAICELRDRLVNFRALAPPNRPFCMYAMHFGGFEGHCPIVAASVVRVGARA